MRVGVVYADYYEMSPGKGIVETCTPGRKPRDQGAACASFAERSVAFGGCRGVFVYSLSAVEQDGHWWCAHFRATAVQSSCYGGNDMP
jgi:hypothetical protein